MGIRIDGASDLINATDGSLTIEGQSINSTGVGTFSGGVKVGSAATIHSTGQFNIGVAATIFANGNATYAGIVTASNTTISSTGIGIGAATNGSANYPSVTISGNSGGAVHFEDDGDLLADIYGSSDGLVLSARKTNDAITFQLNSGSVGEKARFDSNGRLLIGHTATRAIAGGNSLLQIEKNSSELATFLRTSNDSGAPWLAIAKSRSSSGTICQAGDQIGGIAFVPHDGTDLNHHAVEIRAYVDTGIAADDVPGYLSFHTTPDGSSTTRERLRIASGGQVAIGTDTVNGYSDRMLTLYNPTTCYLEVRTNAGDNNSGIIFSKGTAQNSDSYRGYIAYNHSTDRMTFHTGGGTRVGMFDTNGLHFDTNNNSAETGLEDYEEGTFTPTIQGTGSANACTYTSQSGKYTKVGRLVTVDLKISWSAKTADSGSALVNGLPFTIGSNSYAGGGFAIYSSNFSSGGSVITAMTEPSSGNTYFYAALVSLDNSTWYNASAADMWENGTGHYRANFTYMV